MSISEQEIKELSFSFGLQMTELEKTKTGKFNQTYILHIEPEASDFTEGRIEQKKIVLRIAPRPEADFIFYEEQMMAREPEIHNEVLQKTELPVPKIYIYDNSRKIIDRDFMLMEYIPGTPLSGLSLASDTEEEIMEKTGYYLRQLHENCRGEQFGYLKNPHTGLEDSWWRAFSTMWANLILDLETREIYDKKQADRARKVLRQYESIFPEPSQASLLHMDIWGQNILLEENKISGILDWDRSVWGDPEIEFAVLDYCGFNNPAFWRGYGQQPEQNREFKIRARFYHLYEVQKYPIIWHKRAPQPRRLEEYKNYSLNELKKLECGAES